MDTVNTENGRPVVVCLHGGAASSGSWLAFRQAVRGRALVVTPQLSAAEDGTAANVDAQVESVLRQIGNVNGPFHIVGHGLGGAIGTRLAARRPGKVLSLVLYEPTDIDGTLAENAAIPVRLISGTRSWDVMRRRLEQAKEKWPRLTLLKLVGLRHMAPVTHPHLVNPVILDYILPVAMRGEAA